MFVASGTELQIATAIETKAYGVIEKQVKLKKTSGCSFCTGFGHNVQNCSTMAKINKYAKEASKAQEMAWGKAKADYL